LQAVSLVVPHDPKKQFRAACECIDHFREKIRRCLQILRISWESIGHNGSNQGVISTTISIEVAASSTEQRRLGERPLCTNSGIRQSNDVMECRHPLRARNPTRTFGPNLDWKNRRGVIAFAPMKKSDLTCPNCRAGYRRIELVSRGGPKGEFRCLTCNHLLEVFDGSAEVAIRLTVQPTKRRNNGRGPFSI
jgi:predicted Zn finger-like uncharacterized protein